MVYCERLILCAMQMDGRADETLAWIDKVGESVDWVRVWSEALKQEYLGKLDGKKLEDDF